MDSFALLTLQQVDLEQFHLNQTIHCRFLLTLQVKMEASVCLDTFVRAQLTEEIQWIHVQRANTVQTTGLQTQKASVVKDTFAHLLPKVRSVDLMG